MTVQEESSGSGPIAYLTPKMEQSEDMIIVGSTKTVFIDIICKDGIGDYCDFDRKGVVIGLRKI